MEVKQARDGRFYKISSMGMAYNVETDDRVIETIDNAKRAGKRIRIFYGDPETGRDYTEEYDVIGKIGRSNGDFKIPLLIQKSNSYGGSGILTGIIVKITIDKNVVYQHENYHLEKLEIMESKEKTKEMGYSFSVNKDGKICANFKTLEAAERYVKFLKGERNNK